MLKPNVLAAVVIASLFIPMVWVSVTFDIPGQFLFVGVVVAALVIADLVALRSPNQEPLAVRLARAAGAERKPLSAFFRVAAGFLSVAFGFGAYLAIAQLIGASPSAGELVEPLLFSAASGLLLWLTIAGKAPTLWRGK